MENFPQSGWTPSLREVLAEHASQHLHYERAMSHWAANLQALREERRPDRKAAADRALAFLTRHLLIAGQVEKLGPLLAEFQDRVLDEGPLSTMVVRTTQKYRRMLKYPELSYKCGVFALDRLAQSQGWTYDRWKLRSAPSGPEGLSLLDLQKLANEFRMPVLPVRAVDVGVLPVPAVMHSTQGHYVTLLKERAGQVLVHDPGAKRETWVPLEDVAEEASGYFLTPGLRAPAGTSALDAVAAGQIRGRTSSCPPDYGDDFDCDSEDDVEWNDGGERAPGGEPESCSLCEEEEASCCGAAAAVVRPQFLGLWIKDRPVVYRPSKGPMIYPKIRFKRYNEIFEGPSVFGGNWRLAYRMGVWEDESLATVLYRGGRAAAAFDEDGSGGYLPVSQPLPHDGAVLVKPQGGQPWTLKLATGRQIEFGAYVPGIGLAPTKLINRFGHALQLFYDANGRLFRLTDADGKHTHLYYATFFGQTRLHRIVTPDNREAVFGYVQTEAGNVLLASITDATGLVSYFTYPGSQSPNLPFAPGVPESITTPYGTTSFDYASGQDNFEDFVIVTDPTGAKRAYAMNTFTACAPAFEAWQLPVGAPDPNTGLPGTSTIDTVWREWNNTYYWSPKATAALFASTNSNPNNWCWTELKQARIFCWLSDPDNWDHVTDMPNYIQEPSPDGGQTEGQVTFFDYPGKPPGSYFYPGTSRWPSVTTRRLPNGETWWSYTPHNPQGRVLQRKETYTQTNGVLGVRTRATYTYSADGLDLLEERDGSNNLRRSYTWDANHRLMTKREYFGPGPTDYYQTSFTYNPTYGLPATRTDPTGLVTTWTYTPAGGGANGYTVTKTTSPIVSTETEVWSNGRRVSHTDALGFTRNFTYDALDRVTRIDYPSDGTYELFDYVRDSDGAPLLDLDTHRNRLGGLTHYEYDGARRVKTVTDPRGKTTTYTYCTCGSLERITDPLGNKTEFTYDQVGRRKTVTVKRPDGTVDAWTSYDYNALGQLMTETVTINGQDSVRSFAYNHQGLHVATTVDGLLTEKIVFDVEDRPWQVTDRNGVTLTHTYDWLGRRKRTDFPDGGWEEFDYNARGLTQHRRRINPTFTAVTGYVYDEARRKITETTPKNETLSFTYDAAGNLRTLTDGRGKTTTWTYDGEGRLWKKKYHGQSFDQLVYGYDANGRLRSRRSYSTATSYRETLYNYDANGNLTNVNYPAPTADLNFVYDDANRLTQMTDAYGTTSFTYNAAGALLTENGPLTGTPDPDLLTYSYANNTAGLRTGLTLNQPGGGVFSVSYSYDVSRRLKTISSPAGVFTYTYKPVSVGGASYAAERVQQISLPGSLKIVNDFTDPLQRLMQTEFRDAANAVKNSHAYTYNYGSQRTSHTRGGNGHAYGGTSSYTYDPNGQLLSASLESLSYGYDAGWNLTNRSGSSYTVNDRNQVVAEGGLTYAYDANGNRTFKYWNAPTYRNLVYSYDDENQLVSVATDTSYTAEAERWKTELVYDGRQRLRLVQHYSWQYGGWYGPMSQVRYLYDGRVVLQERNSTVPTVSYTRGLDLSGTLEGAGGIGGLLARSRHATTSPYGINGTSYYHADGNGNVTYLASGSGGPDGAYRYDPFGRWLAQTGSYAGANGMRFSSKPWLAHNGSNTEGLYYYGYRFYDPLTQRWLNRDPIGERGGINLYAFVGNDPVQKIDPLGLRGKLCVDKNCKASQLSDMRYVPEDPPVKLVELPKPGECVDVDALYAPGFAWKIPDNARLTIKCDKDGCLSNFNYRKWPWWAGSGPKWEWDFDNDKPGPKPHKWPGNIPPYPNQPPKEEPPKK